MSHADAQIHIRWLRSEEGGRKTIPLHLDYRPTARLGDNPIYWTVQIRQGESTPDATGTQYVDIVFLYREEVGDLLTKGEQIVLTEGQRIVAEGIVTQVYS